MKRSLFIVVLILCGAFTFAQAPIGTPTIAESTELFIKGLSILFEKIKIPLSPFFDYLILVSEPLLKFCFGLFLFLIMFAIIDTIDLFGNNKWIKLAVSVAITFLTMTVLPVGLIDKLIPLYSSLFSTILSVIPLVLLVGLTVKVRSLWAVRILWIMIAFFFTLSFLSVGMPSFTGGFYIQGSIYFVLMIASIVVCVFLKPIRHLFMRAEMHDIGRQMRENIDIDSAVQRSHRTEAEALRES